MFMVKWQTYCASENTWEPKAHLPSELLETFENPEFPLKFLCICKLLHHEFAGGTSGCLRQQMEEPCEFLKGGSGFQRALKRALDP